jgi:hypothetical protein
VTFLGSSASGLCTAVHPGSPGPWHDHLVDLLEITCPRCGNAASARFYGPCDECRRDLRAALGGEHREVEVAAYEPKMNVTPNAVATKD